MFSLRDDMLLFSFYQPGCNEPGTTLCYYCILGFTDHADYVNSNHNPFGGWLWFQNVRGHTHTPVWSLCQKKKSSSSSLFFCSPVFFYSTISLRMLPFKVSDFTWEFQFRLGALCSVTTRPLKLRILVTEMAECPHDNNGISVSLTSYFSPPSLLLAYEYFTYFLQGQLCILSIFIKLFQPEVPRVLLQIC